MSCDSTRTTSCGCSRRRKRPLHRIGPSCRCSAAGAARPFCRARTQLRRFLLPDPGAMPGRRAAVFRAAMPGVDGQEEPLTRVEDLAAYFADQIRAFRPTVLASLPGSAPAARSLSSWRSSSRAAAQRFASLRSSAALTAVLDSSRAAVVRTGAPVQRVGMHVRALTARTWSARRASRKSSVRAGPGATPSGLRRSIRYWRIATRLDGPPCRRCVGTRRAISRAVSSYSFRPANGCAPASPRCAGERWRAMEEHFGPEVCSTAEIMREPNAPAFAELFRRCCENG